MSDLDQRVRLAAFAFLEQQTHLHGDTLPRALLATGFTFDGQRVPPLGPQGVFKPALVITGIPKRHLVEEFSPVASGANSQWRRNP